MSNNDALVLYSGGLQSTVALWWAKQRYDKVYTLTFDYGQKAQLELNAATIGVQLADGDGYEIVEISNALMSKAPIFEDNWFKQALYNNYSELVKKRSIADTTDESYVPLLSMLFMLIATNRAVDKGVATVVTSSCLSDVKNHPDTNIGYFNALEKAINFCLPTPIRIDAPFISMSKSMIISYARDIPGCYNALAYTHTGYDGAYPPTGHDLATIERAGVFESCATPDPLVIRAWKERRMDLPRTRNYDRFRTQELWPFERELLQFLTDTKGKFNS